MKQVTFDDILKARENIRSYVRQTPLEQSFFLGDAEHRFYFKMESLQRARSFKIRGAVNKMLSLTEEERQRGVAAVSSGNHGSSVAYAAQLLGIEKAVIIVPECTPQSKIEKIRYFGGEVHLMGRNYDEAHAQGMAYILQHGLTNIDSCHDDILVYAGQGTVALEILEQVPDIDTIVRLAEALQADPNTLIYGIPKVAKREREYIHMAIAAAIALVLVIISVATRDVFYESIKKDIFRNDYTLPATWLALGYVLMQGLSLVTEVKPVKCIAAKVAVLVLLVVYLYLTRVVWTGGFGGLLALSVIPKIVKAPFVFLLPGAALWLFRMKKVK
jgi:hypothetical protein